MLSIEGKEEEKEEMNLILNPQQYILNVVAKISKIDGLSKAYLEKVLSYNTSFLEKLKKIKTV